MNKNVKNIVFAFATKKYTMKKSMINLRDGQFSLFLVHKNDVKILFPRRKKTAAKLKHKI